jgi:NAD+ kinase
LAAPDDELAAGDAVIVLGGDGAVLVAARAAACSQTPVLAIDLGRLGFLSAVRPNELDMAFEQLLRGELVAEERMMLEARVLRAPSEKRADRNESARVLPWPREDIGGGIGLNDAVVAKSALARILRLSIFVEGDLVAETRADGMIVATPTGSTAYALSSGGPIVHPGVPLLLVCPICAHSLAQRPLVVGPDETVEVHAEWEGDEVASSELEAMLTIDGQIGVRLQPGDIVQVRQAKCKARLLHLPAYNFYDRLREKMGWG